MVKLQLNELEIFCLLQALKVVETKDNIEREKLSSTFKQLHLLDFNKKFNDEPNRSIASLAGTDPQEFDIEDYLPQYIYDATCGVSVKGPFELSMAMLEITQKAKALIPKKQELEGPK